MFTLNKERRQRMLERHTEKEPNKFPNDQEVCLHTQKQFNYYKRLIAIYGQDEALRLIAQDHTFNRFQTNWLLWFINYLHLEE